VIEEVVEAFSYVFLLQVPLRFVGGVVLESVERVLQWEPLRMVGGIPLESVGLCNWSLLLSSTYVKKLLLQKK